MTDKDKVFVIGHKNPDTDSICSAIAYAWLKNRLDSSHHYVPARAGEINPETQYVLDAFDEPVPELVTDVRTQVSDVDLAEGEIVDGSLSVRRAWERLVQKHGSTLIVLDDHGGPAGLITIGDIAKSIMDVQDDTVLADSHTSYSNLIDALGAEVLAGNIENRTVTGKVIIAASNPDQMEELIEPGDMVVLSDRYEAQLCALEMGAGALIVCANGEVNQHIIEMADEKNTVVLRTQYDTFITARLINQSIPIEYFMVRKGILYFRENNFIDKITDTVANVRHRQFPVLDSRGRFVGMLTRQALLELDRKKVILVDHNERDQAVDGLEEAEIMEIVDHHKLGNVQTIAPIMYRGQPVGCTSTIVYMMYQENDIDIPPKMAAMMCSAIISDTLLFRSPTCTPEDKAACEALGEIAGIDLEAHAKGMFSALSDFDSMSDEEILYQDFKEFTASDTHYGVGQISSMDSEALEKLAARMEPYMEKELEEKDFDMIFLMLTDILQESTTFLCVGDDAAEKVAKAAGVPVGAGNSVFLKGVVSRKKQIVPLLSMAIP